MAVDMQLQDGGEYQSRAGRRRGLEADAWANWVAELAPWQLTATLTFDPRRRRQHPPGAQRGRRRRATAWPLRLTEDGREPPRALTRDVAEGFVKRWLRDHERAEGRPLAAIAAMEYHKNGAPHFHALIHSPDGFDVAGLAAFDLAWQSQHGYSRLEPPRSVADCAAYASKYLTKDLERGTVLFWPSRGPLIRDWTRQRRLADAAG